MNHPIFLKPFKGRGELFRFTLALSLAAFLTALSTFAASSDIRKICVEDDRSGNCVETPRPSAPCAAEDKFPAVDSATYGTLKITETLAQPPHADRTKVPPGLTPAEANKLWHLSEGSDTFPYAWLVHLKSALSSEKGTPFLEDLDKKFGLIRDPNPGKYPLPWIGLGGAWSDEAPTKSELVVESGQSPQQLETVRTLADHRKSIGMVGVNCTLCHTGEITHQGKSFVIDGAPAMVSLREFFQDMAGSMAATMLQAGPLEEFLKSMNYPGDAKAEAIRFSRELKIKLGVEPQDDIANFFKDKFKDLYERFDKPGFDATKKATMIKAFYEGRQVMTDHFIELLKMTYGFKSTEEVPKTLKLRMKWLATQLGADPALPVTPEGFDRTDAFGRIANWVARTAHPIPLTATTSLPSIWGIQYRSLFHWNANTNSVVMRNIGQSFGLGAILTNPDAPASDPSRYDSTANLHNLREIEQLVYKYPVPNWSGYFGKVKMDSALRGCATYQKTCVKCHEAKPERVGPEHALLDYKVLPLTEVGTDPTYTLNQATPVEGVPFRDALFGFAGNVRNRYYQNNGIPPEQQKEWEGRSLRGNEVFRDTVLGLPKYPTGSELDYVNTPAGSGFPARHLSGVWASPPYLHNGSVSSMAELLKPAAERSRLFFVGTSEYDTENMGFESGVETIPHYAEFRKEFEAPKGLKRLRGTSSVDPEKELQAACEKYQSRCFKTSLTGNSNAGHEGPLYGTGLQDSEKRDLIEFLKILAPEQEYSWKEKPLYQVKDGICRLPD